jgi:tetrapyrrole methylase family protein/MazG family protein
MITVIGLGPGDLDRVPGMLQSLLMDPNRTIIIRTKSHPAAEQLAQLREVAFCDDLYESGGSFDDVYEAIVTRVIEASSSGPVVYAVPGSPMIGEFAVRKLIEADVDLEVLPAESFVDAILGEVGCDPLDKGIQILNGHDLPDPLVLDKPTIIAHLDRPEILADVCASVDRVTPEETTVTVLAGLGASDAVVVERLPEDVDPYLAGYRTSLFVDAEPAGLVGAVRTMRLLRTECPWDLDQTHQSLIKNLVEESYELIDAIRRLDTSQLDTEQPDWVGYAEVEDELGDVLLQVLFHSVIARQAGAFDIDDVAEVMRRKLVRRHPHVFGDAEATTAAEVKANWDLIKEAEKGDNAEESILDGVPSGMPGLHRASKVQNRAAKVGFDWEEAAQVLPKVNEEVEELMAAMTGDGDPEAEIGDVLFTMVNLARHLGLDAEVALRGATDRFEERFRRMEAVGPLEGLDLEALNGRWEQAKSL